MTETVKHTPGPWEVDGTGDIIRTKTGVNERGGMTGGVCVAQFWTRPTAEDARLIAAAPAMAEALARLLSTVERLDLTEGVCCCGDDMERHSDPMSCGHSPVDAGEYHHGQAIDAARAAIALASGGQP